MARRISKGLLAYGKQTMDAARKTGKFEPVSGVGDEAYLRNNANRYAELIARTGPHLLTLQLSIDEKRPFEAAKPALLELGRTFVAKLR